MPTPLRTDRLLLRPWRADDRAPFAALNADPVVMAHFPGTMTRVDSDRLVERIERHFAEHDVGLWAVEAPGVAPFVGFVGLAHVGFDAPFTPAVEIGWRLARPYWGRGYATEAARAALDDGWARLGLDEVVAITVPANTASRGVMERLGMRRDPAEDFDHPALPVGHRLRRHVLYRVQRPPRSPGDAMTVGRSCRPEPAQVPQNVR